MRVIGIIFVFLAALYPISEYALTRREKRRKYAELLSALNRINDKILDTGTNLYEIFRDFDNGELSEVMLECARMGNEGRRSVIARITAELGEDGEAVCSFISSFGRAPSVEEKKKLEPLIDRIARKEAELCAAVKDKERSMLVLYASALASALLLAL